MGKKQIIICGIIAVITAVIVIVFGSHNATDNADTASSASAITTSQVA